MSCHILDLPMDLFDYIYKLLPEKHQKMLMIAQLSANLFRINGEDRLKKFYDWNTPRKLLDYLYGTRDLKTIDKKDSNDFTLDLQNMRSKMECFCEMHDILLNIPIIKSRYVIWDNEKIIERKRRWEVLISRKFWSKKLNILKVAREFLLCGCTPNCWRCQKNSCEITKRVGTIAIAKCRADNRYYPGIIIDISSDKLYTIYFDQEPYNHPLPPVISQDKTPKNWLSRPANCWMACNSWEKGVPIPNGYRIDDIYGLPLFWLRLAKRDARTALALL
jgi:hypothetical protein